MQVSLAPLHTRHTPPSVPHEALPELWHTPPLQHPPAQPTPSQAQVLLAVQCRPAAHGALGPQPQVPLARQVLDRTASHPRHAPPSAPHEAKSAGETHVVPLQHPAHVAGSHSQAPPLHRCPTLHMGLAPQVQAPSRHASARRGSQRVQTLPALPQVETPASKQLPPEQQPLLQLVESHPAHCWLVQPLLQL